MHRAQNRTTVPATESLVAGEPSSPLAPAVAFLKSPVGMALFFLLLGLLGIPSGVAKQFVEMYEGAPAAQECPPCPAVAPPTTPTTPGSVGEPVVAPTPVETSASEVDKDSDANPRDVEAADAPGSK